MLKRISVLAAMVLMVACHSNPYSNVKGPLDLKPPQPKVTETNNFYVELESTSVDVLENASVQVNVKGVVPKGDPILKYKNLPPFISVNPSGTVLTLAPGYGDATDPKHPEAGAAVYKVDILLSSTDSVASTIPPTTLTIVVHNVPRDLKITNFDQAAWPTEGTEFVTMFDVQSADYPNGPFSISGTGLPVGMKVDPVSTTSFRITYSASFKTTTVSNANGTCGGRMCKSLKWTLTAIDPRGNATSTDATWKVVDVRQNPKVVGPATVTGTLPNAIFSVLVEDPNGEVVPAVKATVPNGTATLTPIASSNGSATENPYVMQQAQWAGVPDTSKGTTEVINLESCVYSSATAQNQCVTTPVNVQF